MTETRKEAVRAGAFILISGSVLVIFLVIVLGKGWFKKERTFYTVFNHTVVGLEKGSQVKYLGVPAGSVGDIRFVKDDFPKIRITMKINDYITIKEGTHALLKQAAITGLAHIELVGGDKNEQEMDEGAEIPSEISLFQKISKTLPEVLEQVPLTLLKIEETATRLTELLGDENQLAVTRILDRIERAVESIDRNVESTSKTLRQEVSSFSRNLQGELSSTAKEYRALASETLAKEVELVSGEIRSFLQGTKAELASTLKPYRELASGQDAAQLVKQLNSLSKTLNQIGRRVERTLGRLEISLQGDKKILSDSLFHLRETLRGARGLVDQLQENPSSLIFSTPVMREREIPEPSGK